MAVDDYDGETVATGRWLYAGTVPKTVEIVAFDCDYFFERMPCDDGRDPYERHPLNADGRLFYIKTAGDVLPLRPFGTVGDARAWADAQPWAPIAWIG